MENKELKSHPSRDKWMTKDEVKEIDDFLVKINECKSIYGDDYATWTEVEQFYSNDNPEYQGKPNSKVNIINPSCEGQLAIIAQRKFAATVKGWSPSDQMFSSKVKTALEWTFDRNKLSRIVERHERRRILFGNGIFKLWFDTKAVSGFGLAKIFPVPLNKFFVDPNVTDYLQLQDAEWIAETMVQSKAYAVQRYGEKKADAIVLGVDEYRNDNVFEDTDTASRDTTFTLILLWSRQDGKLRLREVTGNGLLLYDSHKEGTKKDNQKSAKKSVKSYYKYVHDMYPYVFTPVYVKEGKLLGFGDGKLLLPLQKLINELYNKIRVCARPNIILINDNAEIDLEDYDENTLEPRAYKDTGGADPIIVKEWGSINQSWWQLLLQIHKEAQNTIRFSNLMTGQGTSTESATEAALQHQQGSASTVQKIGQLESALDIAAEYLLGLMLQFYNEGKIFRLSEDTEKYDYIDFRDMTKVPALMPSDNAQNRTASEYGNKASDFMLVESGGKAKTRPIELDINVSMGTGLASNNETFMWQMIEKLSQMMGYDKQTGQLKPVISLQEMRQLINNILGIHISSDTDMLNIMQQEGQPPKQSTAPINVDVNSAQAVDPGMRTGRMAEFRRNALNGDNTTA